MGSKVCTPMFKRTLVQNTVEHLGSCLLSLICVDLTHKAHILHVILIPVIQSEGNLVQNERKLDDDHEAGGCFNLGRYVQRNIENNSLFT